MKLLFFVLLSLVPNPINLRSNQGVQVYDGNRQPLGTLEGLPSITSYAEQPGYFVLFRNGYFITMRFDGRFPIGFQAYDLIMWTGQNCTGNAFLLGTTNNIVSTHLVIYSGQSNTFFVPSGSGPLASAVTTPAISSVEAGFNDLSDSSACYPVSDWIYPGWPLSVFDPKTLGWNVSGNPAQVATPVTLQ